MMVNPGIKMVGSDAMVMWSMVSVVTTKVSSQSGGGEESEAKDWNEGLHDDLLVVMEVMNWVPWPEGPYI